MSKSLYRKGNLAYLGIIFSSVGFLIYSYSQVDLNLTLSGNTYYLAFQSVLTNLGYFHRPLSTLIYIALLICLLISYFWLIHQANSNKLKLSNIVKISLIVSIVLTIAYPAFSYDIFNYIFDARILAFHHQNPYLHTALDFPNDLWIRFMRWTHRTYPYGPTWLPLTLPFYVLGLDKFLLTLLSFKSLGLLSYFLGAYGIYLTLKKYQPKHTNLGLVLYLFNPLVLIEGLVSSHLDMAMAGLMLLGIGLSSKKLASWVFIVVSAGIKYVSAAVIPGLYLLHSKKISYKSFVNMSVILSYSLTIIVIFNRELLPWYFLVPFGLTCLLPNNKYALSLMFGLIPATLLRYAPFLYVGEYTPWVISSRNMLTIASLILASLVFGIYFSRRTSDVS